MADVFVSYAREDKSRAAEIVRLLEDYGWDVFWDQETRAGTHWPKVLEEELNKARCLVALWTTTSIASRWVRIESYEALQTEKLVPVLLDEVRPPLEFRQTHTFDLVGWSGDRDDARLEHLLADLTALAKAPSPHGGASRRVQLVVPTTLRREMPAATAPTAMSAAHGVPDAQPATIAPMAADVRHVASSSPPIAGSAIAPSRALMLGLGVIAAVGVAAWLFSAREPSPEPAVTGAPTPAAPSVDIAAPAPPTPQPAPIDPLPAKTAAIVPAPEPSKPVSKPAQKLPPPRCLTIAEKFQQTGQLTAAERDFLRSKECQS